MKFDRRLARGEAILLPNGNIEAPVAVEATVDGETVYGDGRGLCWSGCSTSRPRIGLQVGDSFRLG